MDAQVNQAQKENQPKKVLKGTADLMATLVLLVLLEKGVPLVVQGLVDQVNLERKAVREIQAFQELQDDLV